MNRRSFLGGAGTALAAVFVGCLSGDADPGRNETDGSDETSNNGNGSEENEDDDHLAGEGDTVTGHIYNYEDEELTFEIIIISEEGKEAVNDEFTVEADSAKGIGTIGNVFVKYTAEITVESLGLERTEQFEPGGKGTLEIRLVEDGELEIYFIPVD